MSGINLAIVGNSYGSLPVNTDAPAVSGTATVGSTLSSSTGTWTGAPAPAFTYQWQRGSTNIGSATSSSYTIVSADAGSTIRCVVTATNSLGAVSANSNNSSAVPSIGQQAYTSSGSYTWVAPAGVSSVAIVAVGGGSNGGGGLGYKNSQAVTAGSSYTVVVGAGAVNRSGAGNDSYFISTSVVKGGGGVNNGTGGSYVGTGGGNGGTGQYGGGGAGGYSGNGGSGGDNGSGTAGNGGGGGGGSWDDSGGGGVGLLGEGSSGAQGLRTSQPNQAGYGGSGGANGLMTLTWPNGYGNPPATRDCSGGAYGGGHGLYGNSTQGDGGVGAVRIIWGTNRSFPSTNTGDL